MLNLSSEPGVDFEMLHNGLLRFEPCQKRLCVNISIVQDNCVVEEDEEFLVVLDRVAVNGFEQENKFLLDTTEGRVIISDDDGECSLGIVCHLFLYHKNRNLCEFHPN